MEWRAKHIFALYYALFASIFTPIAYIFLLASRLFLTLNFLLFILAVFSHFLFLRKELSGGGGVTFPPLPKRWSHWAVFSSNLAAICLRLSAASWPIVSTPRSDTTVSPSLPPSPRTLAQATKLKHVRSSYRDALLHPSTVISFKPYTIGNKNH